MSTVSDRAQPTCNPPRGTLCVPEQYALLAPSGAKGWIHILVPSHLLRRSLQPLRARFGLLQNRVNLFDVLREPPIESDKTFALVALSYRERFVAVGARAKLR